MKKEHAFFIVLYISLVLYTSCDMYPMKPLRIVAYTPSAVVVDTETLNAVSITFSADVSKQLVENAFSLEEDGITMSGKFTWSGNRTVLFQPFSGFSPSAHYLLSLSSTAEDYQGNNLEKPFAHEFRGTADSRRPRLLSISPADNSILETLTPELVFVFSEPMDTGSVLDGITIKPSVDGYFTKTEDSCTYRYILTGALVWQTWYTITIQEYVRDTQGNTKGHTDTVAFFTGTDSEHLDIEAVSVSLPERTGLFPEDLETEREIVTPGIEKDADIIVRFSKPVDIDSLGGNISIVPAVSHSVTWNDTGDGFTLSAEKPFIYNTVYTLTIHTGISDRQGNPLREKGIFKFRTNGASSQPPRIVRASLTNTFSEGMPVMPLTNLEPLSHISFHPALCEQACYGFFDLHLSLADGAHLSPVIVSSALSISAEHAAVTPIACQTGSGITFMAEQLPPDTSPDTEVIRIVVDIDNSTALYNDKSGKISLILDTTLRDSLDNYLPEQWSMDIYTTN